MRVIFLDIDGVLNSFDSALAFFDKPRSEEGILYNADRLDPVSIGLLGRAVQLIGAKIVVSSTWRKMYTIEELGKIFRRYNWECPIIGITDNANMAGQVRGNEIQRWLDSNGNPEYLILDDDSDMLPEQEQNFLNVSNINGFRIKHYCKVLRHFGNPDERLEKQANFVRTSKIIGI